MLYSRDVFEQLWHSFFFYSSPVWCLVHFDGGTFYSLSFLFLQEKTVAAQSPKHVTKSASIVKNLPAQVGMYTLGEGVIEGCLMKEQWGFQLLFLACHMWRWARQEQINQRKFPQSAFQQISFGLQAFSMVKASVSTN